MAHPQNAAMLSVYKSTFVLVLDHLALAMKDFKHGGGNQKGQKPTDHLKDRDIKEKSEYECSYVDLICIKMYE